MEEIGKWLSRIELQSRSERGSQFLAEWEIREMEDWESVMVREWEHWRMGRPKSGRMGE